MAKPITPKASKAKRGGAAFILPDGTITENHPGTEFTCLNRESVDNELSNGNDAINYVKSGSGGKEAQEEDGATGQTESIGTNDAVGGQNKMVTKKRSSEGSTDKTATKKHRADAEGASEIHKGSSAGPEHGAPSTPPPNRRCARPQKTAQATSGSSSADSTRAPGSTITAATSINASPISRVGEPPAKKRALAGTVIKGRGIPTSIAEASEADRAMLRMREEGKTWIEINAMWEAMTGEKPGKSTLPNRYTRLKSNLMTLEKGDGDRLRRARALIEKRLEIDKWTMIKEAMKEDGTTADYTTTFLQKESKKQAAADEQVQCSPAGAGGDAVKTEDHADEEG